MKISTCLVAVSLYLGTGVAVAQLPFEVPECPQLEQWASELPLDRGSKDSPEWQARAAAARQRMLSDERTAEVFGRPLSAWNTNDDQAARTAFYDCKTGLLQRGDKEGAMRLSTAGSLLVNKTRSKGTQAATDSRMRAPDCTEVGAWAAGWAAPDGTSHADRIARMFDDTRTTALFGVPYSGWDVNDTIRAQETITACRGELFPRSGPALADTPARDGLLAAQSHLNNSLRQMRAPRTR
jgi:hypothetical protein